MGRTSRVFSMSVFPEDHARLLTHLEKTQETKRDIQMNILLGRLDEYQAMNDLIATQRERINELEEVNEALRNKTIEPPKPELKANEFILTIQPASDLPKAIEAAEKLKAKGIIKGDTPRDLIENLCEIGIKTAFKKYL